MHNSHFAIASKNLITLIEHPRQLLLFRLLSPLMVMLRLRQVLLLSSLFFLSCSSPDYQPGPRFNDQSAVGFSKISIISVAPWNTVAPFLAPTFALRADEALTKVVRAGRTEGQSVVDELSASLAAHSGSSPSDTQPSASAEIKDTSSSGGSANSQPSSSSISDRPSTSIAPSTTSDSSIPALTQYELASSLYEEVKLLNTYIRHVAAERDATPYLISMDVSLFPSTPRAEVNASVLLSFQWEDADGVPADAPLMVLPVVSSEEIELNDHSRAIQNSLNIALALTGTSPSSLFGGSFGADAKVSQAIRELNNIAGRDVNSLQMVSNAAPDALIVRFGASYGVETRYALYPQTRRIHCLVLIPTRDVSPLVSGEQPVTSGERPGKLEVIANTTFQYADTATFQYADSENDIPVRDESTAIQADALQFQAETGITVSKEQFLKLLTAYSSGDHGAFLRVISTTDAPFAWAAWAEMSKLMLYSPWNISSVDIPHLREPNLNIYLGYDDGELAHIALPAYGFSKDAGCWTLEFAFDSFDEKVKCGETPKDTSFEENFKSKKKYPFVMELPSDVTSPNESVLQMEFRSLQTMYTSHELGSYWYGCLYYHPECGETDTDPSQHLFKVLINSDVRKRSRGKASVTAGPKAKAR